MNEDKKFKLNIRCLNILEFEIKRRHLNFKQSGKFLKDRQIGNRSRNNFCNESKGNILFVLRYFCEPVLVIIKISQDTKNKIKFKIPKMPFENQERAFAQYKLVHTVTSLICQ